MPNGADRHPTTVPSDAYSADGGVTIRPPFRPQAGLVGPVVEGSGCRPGRVG